MQLTHNPLANFTTRVIKNYTLMKNRILISILAMMVLCFAGCSEKKKSINEDLAIAPKDMTGKTLKVDGATIKFSSNTSATISNYLGTASRSTVSYNRTSEVQADLKFFYHAEGGKDMSERNYDLKLTFANENEGVASGSYTYKLTIQKGTKYEKSDSGSKNLTNAIFSIK